MPSLPQTKKAAPKKADQRFDIPLRFETVEADSILAALQVFPPDNPWKEDVSQRRTPAYSRAIVASIGSDKPLDFNLDMNFVFVPPDQPQVPVRGVLYPEKSNPGLFPVPDIIPFQNRLLQCDEDKKTLPLPGLTLDDLQRHGTGGRHGLQGLVVHLKFLATAKNDSRKKELNYESDPSSSVWQSGRPKV